MQVGGVQITDAMLIPKAPESVVPLQDLVKGGKAYVQTEEGAALVEGDVVTQMVPDGGMFRVPVSVDARAVSKEIQHALTVQANALSERARLENMEHILAGHNPKDPLCDGCNEATARPHL